MTLRLISLYVIAPLMAAVAMMFFLVGSADAANLYWVGTTAADYNDATNWNTSDPGACNDGGGDAGAAPGASDAVILDPDCDTDLLIPDGTEIFRLVTQAGYSGDVDQAGTLTVSDTVIIVTGAELNSDGNDLSVGGDFTNGGDYISGTNTVTFTGSLNLSTGGTGTGQDFNNVTISASGEVALDGAALDIDGDLTIASGGYLTLGGQDITVVGTYSNEGEFELSGTETISLANEDSDSGKTTYFNDGGGSVGLAGLSEFYDIEFDDDAGGTTWTLAAAVDINNDLTITGGTIDADGNTINIAGDWLNSDTFTHNDNSVVFDGSQSQTITGTNTFYDLTKQNPGGTFTIPSSVTTTVDNDLAISGTSNPINFFSSSASAQATLSYGGTGTVSLLNVRGINNTGTTLNCFTGCQNFGSNSGWLFTGTGSNGSGGSANVVTSVTLTSPSAGTSVDGNSTLEIKWSGSGDDIDSVSLWYSLDGGVTYEEIASGLENDGSYMWDVINTTTLKAMVQVMLEDADGNELASDESARFSITMVDSTDGSDDGQDGFDDNGDDMSNDFEYVDMMTTNGETVRLMPGGLFRGETLSGVYIVHEDGTRSVFPTAAAFLSYGYSFDDVVFVEDDQLQKLELGARVTMAPGELVKIQSDNRVFRVDAGAVLRHIPDEATAISMYGDDWATLVTDINVVFWGDYTLGSSL